MRFPQYGHFVLSYAPKRNGIATENARTIPTMPTGNATGTDRPSDSITIGAITIPTTISISKT